MLSAKQQRLRGKGKPSKRRFIQLWQNVKRSTAYHGLSLGARCAPIELLDKYTGCNNGMIVMSVRDLADRLNCSQGSAANFLAELDDAGLAHPMKVGTWRGRRATTWRLTLYVCNATGEFPVTQWDEKPASPKPKPAMGDAERSRRYREKKRHGLSSPGKAQKFTHESTNVTRHDLRTPTKAQKRNSSIERHGPSSSTKAHIHLHQREGDELKERKLGWLHKWNGDRVMP